MSRPRDIYGGKDPRELPLYSVADGARVLRMNPATIRAWAFGRPYPTLDGARRWPALIHAPEKGRLCFKNLVELHVLSALRLGPASSRRVRVATIREASRELEERIGTRHPLADVGVHTDYVDIYVDIFGRLLNVTDRQQPLRDVIEPLLDRIERDESGIARRLLLSDDASHPDLVVIDPARRFGRPVLRSVNIETAVIHSRFLGGETVRDIARELDIDRDEADAAVQFEVLRSRRAA